MSGVNGDYGSFLDRKGAGYELHRVRANVHAGLFIRFPAVMEFGDAEDEPEDAVAEL